MRDRNKLRIPSSPPLSPKKNTLSTRGRPASFQRECSVKPSDLDLLFWTKSNLDRSYFPNPIPSPRDASIYLLQVVIISCVMKSVALQIDMFSQREDLNFVPCSVPSAATKRLRYHLARLGGIASAKSIHESGDFVDKRSTTASLKNARSIENLGAGYYALRGIPIYPVADWLFLMLQKNGPLSEKECIEKIKNNYPNGDALAIKSWLRLQPKWISRIQNQYHASKYRNLP